MGMGSVWQLFKRATFVCVIIIAKLLEPGNVSLTSKKESGALMGGIRCRVSFGGLFSIEDS